MKNIQIKLLMLLCGLSAASFAQAQLLYTPQYHRQGAFRELGITMPGRLPGEPAAPATKEYKPWNVVKMDLLGIAFPGEVTLTYQRYLAKVFSLSLSGGYNGNWTLNYPLSFVGDVLQGIDGYGDSFQNVFLDFTRGWNIQFEPRLHWGRKGERPGGGFFGLAVGYRPITLGVQGEYYRDGSGVTFDPPIKAETEIGFHVISTGISLGRQWAIPFTDKGGLILELEWFLYANITSLRDSKITYEVTPPVGAPANFDVYWEDARQYMKDSPVPIPYPFPIPWMGFKFSVGGFM